MKITCYRVLFALSFLLVSAVFAYSSGPGTFDLSFAGTGYRYDGFGGGRDVVQKIAIQPDGKIVAVGYTSRAESSTIFNVALARYNADGTLDPTFNGGGKLVIPVISGPEQGRAVAIQSDGKIVVAGYAFSGGRNDFLIMRFHPNGMLDTTFDGDGRAVTVASGTDNKAFDVTIQPDGKIVAAGTANGCASALRYNSNGSPDITFDGDGIVITPLSTFNGTANSVAVQPDGKIVTAGTHGVGSASDFGLIRYDANGSLDAAFNGSGFVTTPVLTFDSAWSVTLQTDGKIVAAGAADGDFAVVRYNTDGSLDTGFDGDGKVTTSFAATGLDVANSVAMRPGGGIIAVGSSEVTSSTVDFAVAAYNANGSPDTSFDADGTLTMSFGTTVDRAFSTVVQANGKIVVAGFSRRLDDDFALVRFNTNGSFDTGFDGDGLLTSDVGSGRSAGRGVVVQPDDKIVVLATTQVAGFDRSIGLVRFSPDGLPDPSFGVGGKVSTIFQSGGSPLDMILQPDGKIVVAGSFSIENSRRILVARYNTDGSPDTSFGGSGFVTTNVPGATFSGAGSVALQPDGKVVVTGYGFVFSAGVTLHAVARYNPDGSLDTAFDDDGVVTSNLLGPGSSVVIQQDGKIVADGTNGSGSSTKFALARYNPNGALDATFDGDGIVITQMLEGGASNVRSLALLADGRILAGGHTSNASNRFFGIARYNTDGSLDTSFDGDGKVVTQVLANDFLNKIRVQSDGKIVAAGQTNNASNTDMAIVRYNFDGSLDLSYGTGGKAVFDLGGDESIYGLTIDADGKALVAGTRSSDILTARIMADLASLVDVGGRVTSSANGQGIGNAQVVLRDENNNRRYALTNPFGYYVFSGVSSNEVYVVSVSAKRYRMQPLTQTVTVTGSISNVDFTGNPGSDSIVAEPETKISSGAIETDIVKPTKQKEK